MTKIIILTLALMGCTDVEPNGEPGKDFACTFQFPNAERKGATVCSDTLADAYTVIGVYVSCTPEDGYGCDVKCEALESACDDFGSIVLTGPQ